MVQMIDTAILVVGNIAVVILLCRFRIQVRAIEVAHQERLARLLATVLDPNRVTKIDFTSLTVSEACVHAGCVDWSPDGPSRMAA